MARNYRYISGDSHLEIDAKWWVGRVPKQYRDQAPRLVRLPDGSDAWAIEGQPLRQVPFETNFAGVPAHETAQMVAGNVIAFFRLASSLRSTHTMQKY